MKYGIERWNEDAERWEIVRWFLSEDSRDRDFNNLCRDRTEKFRKVNRWDDGDAA
jgi:hypothetical protein